MHTNREVSEMIKSISLGKLIALPKLKMKKQERVFDKEWKMYFSCEEERIEFRAAIERAEKNIAEGNYYTQEEVDKIFKEEFGI